MSNLIKITTSDELVDVRSGIQKPSCATCRHWSSTGRENQGQCRESSPQVFTCPSPLGQMGFVSTWPSTAADAWCGAYKKLVTDELT